MINAIQHGVTQVVGSMDSSLESVEAVSSSTELASQTIERIGNSTHSIERTIAISPRLGERANSQSKPGTKHGTGLANGRENSATVEELATTRPNSVPSLMTCKVLLRVFICRTKVLGLLSADHLGQQVKHSASNDFAHVQPVPHILVALVTGPVQYFM
jgi:hypothetical protein